MVATVARPRNSRRAIGQAARLPSNVASVADTAATMRLTAVGPVHAGSVTNSAYQLRVSPRGGKSIVSDAVRDSETVRARGTSMKISTATEYTAWMRPTTR